MAKPHGRQLWALYLEGVFPVVERPEIDVLNAEQIAKIVMPLVGRITAAAKPDASPGDEIEMADALWLIAKRGGIEALEGLSAATRARFAALARDALLALAIEHFGKAGFSIPLPRHASDEIRATAALLFLLGTLQTDAELRARLQQSGRMGPDRRSRPRR